MPNQPAEPTTAAQELSTPAPVSTTGDADALPTTNITSVVDGHLQQRAVRLTLGLGEARPLVITQLNRVKFQVAYTDEDEPPVWKVEVFNLRDETEQRIVQRGRTYRLEAGYGDQVGLLGQGATLEYERIWQAPNKVLKIILSPQTDLYTGRVARTWSEGAGAKRVDVFRDLATLAALRLGPTDNLPELQQDANFTWNGNAREGMKTYARRLNLMVAFVGGRVLLERALPPREIATSDAITTDADIDTSRGSVPNEYQEAGGVRNRTESTRGGDIIALPSTDYLIIPRNGLIGLPSVTDQGFKAKLRLNNELIIGRRVTVQTRNLNGRYRLSKIQHAGDTWEGDFVTQVEGVTI